MLETKPTQTGLSRPKGSFIAALCIGIGLICATAFAQDYHMNIDNGMITLSADKVDLKTILLDISKEANILIQFPAGLQKQVSIKLTNVSIRNALKRLLRGQDYAVIYSASRNNSISEVRVLPEQWGNRKPVRSPTQDRQANLIRRYNRQLDDLRDRLTKVTRGSATEKRILRQIESMERTVESLESGFRR